MVLIPHCTYLSIWFILNIHIYSVFLIIYSVNNLHIYLYSYYYVTPTTLHISVHVHYLHLYIFDFVSLLVGRKLHFVVFVLVLCTMTIKYNLI